MTATSKITAIATQLPRSKAPLEWAVSANGILFTAQIPIDASGQVVAGGIEAQARQPWRTSNTLLSAPAAVCPA